MRTNPVRLSSGSSYTGIFFEGIEEWSQFFEPCNWRTFHPVLFEFEDDRMMGGVEMTIIVLGLGFRVRWNHSRTETVEDIEKQVADIKGGMSETVPFKFPGEGAE